MNESLLSVKNASGRQVSLLNAPAQDTKRKYHCTEPGCNKSFTTSGHLARHNRIHTGEKNFPCLFPGCQSRFSRQDNMMQHYKTHMSPKSKRSQKRGLVEDIRPKPRLHAHHRIRSETVRVEQPLTIDQHLTNYHESLKTTSDKLYNNDFPAPLSFVAKRPSTTLVNQPQQQQQQKDGLFYQHRPLQYIKPSGNNLPYTLLHPTQRQENLPEKVVQNQ